ncbi:hypothetical protein OG21DRAFT_1527957, partial [Imleria badia]
KQYVVKDCWTRSGRMAIEEDMLRRMKEKGLTYGVPVLAVAWTVQISGKDDSTDLRRPSYLFEQGSLPPETRIHCHLLLESVDEPLTSFSCIQELLSVLINIVDVHERLIFLCCILHRAISINNILMYIFEGTWPLQAIEGDESDARLSQREEIIQQHRFRHGLLIDFDYAKFTDGMAGATASGGEQTGTIPFMAINIFEEYVMPEGAINHKLKHNLESLIYVLVRDLAVFKRSDLHLQLPLQEFTDYFKDLKDTVGLLYDALLQSYSNGGPKLGYTTIKNILLNAFLTIQEPSLLNTK